MVREDRLSGRVALVTGATGGIGEAIVRRLAAEGATVVVTDLDADQCEKLAGQLPGGALGLRLDVTDETAWETVVAQVTDRLGSLSVLVNNAGIASMGTVETETRETWDRVIGVTQTGVWLGMKHGGPAIERSGGGSIVNIASPTGMLGVAPGYSAYSTSKGGVFGLSRVSAAAAPSSTSPRQPACWASPPAIRHTAPARAVCSG